MENEVDREKTKSSHSRTEGEEYARELSSALDDVPYFSSENPLDRYEDGESSLFMVMDRPLFNTELHNDEAYEDLVESLEEITEKGDGVDLIITGGTVKKPPSNYSKYEMERLEVYKDSILKADKGMNMTFFQTKEKMEKLPEDVDVHICYGPQDRANLLDLYADNLSEFKSFWKEFHREFSKIKRKAGEGKSYIRDLQELREEELEELKEKYSEKGVKDLKNPQRTINLLKKNLSRTEQAGNEDKAEELEQKIDVYEEFRGKKEEVASSSISETVEGLKSLDEDIEERKENVKRYATNLKRLGFSEFEDLAGMVDRVDSIEDYLMEGTIRDISLEDLDQFIKEAEEKIDELESEYWKEDLGDIGTLAKSNLSFDVRQKLIEETREHYKGFLGSLSDNVEVHDGKVNYFTLEGPDGEPVRIQASGHSAYTDSPKKTNTKRIRKMLHSKKLRDEWTKYFPESENLGEVVDKFVDEGGVETDLLDLEELEEKLNEKKEEADDEGDAREDVVEILEEYDAQEKIVPDFVIEGNSLNYTAMPIKLSEKRKKPSWIISSGPFYDVDKAREMHERGYKLTDEIKYTVEGQKGSPADSGMWIVDYDPDGSERFSQVPLDKIGGIDEDYDPIYIEGDTHFGKGNQRRELVEASAYILENDEEIEALIDLGDREEGTEKFEGQRTQSPFSTDNVLQQSLAYWEVWLPAVCSLRERSKFKNPAHYTKGNHLEELDEYGIDPDKLVINALRIFEGANEGKDTRLDSLERKKHEAGLESEVDEYFMQYHSLENTGFGRIKLEEDGNISKEILLGHKAGSGNKMDSVKRMGDWLEDTGRDPDMVTFGHSHIPAYGHLFGADVISGGSAESKDYSVKNPIKTDSSYGLLNNFMEAVSGSWKIYTSEDGPDFAEFEGENVLKSIYEEKIRPKDDVLREQPLKLHRKAYLF